MTEKELLVSAIRDGTVIDHIFSGQAMKIVKILGLTQINQPVTLGLNLPSDLLGKKDLIKVEGREIDEMEANQIAIFSPSATVNIIRDYQVVKKFQVLLPSYVSHFLTCPNEKCVTRHEKIVSLFHVKRFGEHVELHCHYCQRSFSHDYY